MKLKKILALFIVLAMVLSTMSFSVFAEGDDVDNAGTEAVVVEDNTTENEETENEDEGSVPAAQAVEYNVSDYASLQAAIDAACNDGGTVTVVLSGNVTENVTITEKVGLYLTIEGGDNTLTGTITINALSDTNNNRRITINNLNFATTDADVYFITANATNHYPRLTVTNCDFTGTGNADTVALRTKSAYDLIIKNCTGTKLHSFIQNTAGVKVTIRNVTVTDSKSGLALGTAQNVEVRGCNIDVTNYGIRLDAVLDTSATLNGNVVTAYTPVSVRKASATDYKLTFTGSSSVYTPTNNDGVWCAICNDEYEEGVALNEATGNVKITYNSDVFDESAVYGAYQWPVEVVFDDGSEKGFDSLASAMSHGTSKIKEKIVVYNDISEDIGNLSGNIVCGDTDGSVTINNTYTDWTYGDENFTIGEGVSFNAEAIFITDVVADIYGSVTTENLYIADNAKVSIYAPGSVLINGSTHIRRNDDIDAGVYIYGDNDDSTIEYKSTYYTGHYSGTFYAKDANVEMGYTLLKNSNDTAYGDVAMQFDNSSLKVTGTDDGQNSFYIDGEAELSLSNNSSVENIRDFHILADTDLTLNVEDGSSIAATNVNVAQGLPFKVTENAEGTLSVSAWIPVEVETYDELVALYSNGTREPVYAVMKNDITGTAAENSGYAKAGIVVQNGDILDGKGYTLTINGANSGWECGIAVKGGTIKNLTIAGAFRGMFMPGANGDLIVDNCVFTDVVYTFNSDGGSKDYGVTIKNSEIYGWTSFSNVHKFVTFENCTFGEGNGYEFVRPYQGVTFTNCEFNEGMEIDAQKVEDSNPIKIDDCTYNGEDFTAESAASMFYNGGNVVIDGQTVTMPAFNTVATIGKTKYESLQAAIDDAQNGDTIKIEADIDIGNGEALIRGKEVVIDLNSHTIEGSKQARVLFVDLYARENKNGKLTLIGTGTVKNNNANGYAIYVGGNSELIVDGDINISGATIGVILAPLGAGRVSKLTVNDGTITGKQGISASGAARDVTTEIIINDGEITGTQAAIYHPQRGILTVNGGTIKCDGEGTIAMRSGDLVINGGTIVGTLDVLGDYHATNHEDEFTSADINGGDFTGATLKYTEGTVVKKAEDVTLAAPAGYQWNEMNDGTVCLVPATGVVAEVNGTFYATLQQAFDAANDGDVINVVSDIVITDETSASNGGGWYDGVNYLGDKDITLNLNGFKVSDNGCVNDRLFRFENNGSKANTITIKNGTLEANSNAYSAVAFSSSNAHKITVNLEDVTAILNGHADGNGAAVLSRGGAEVNVKDGTVIIAKSNYAAIEAVSTVNIYDGAEIYQNGTTSYCGALVGVSGNGTVNVYGGYGKSAMGGFIAMTSGGTINVYGGQWIANTDGTYANGNKSVLIAQSQGGASSKINVYGGNFAGGYNCYGDAVGDAQINIAGGTFTTTPAGQSYVVIADGYEVNANADGTYTVSAPRKLSVVADKTNVVADEEVVVSVVINGENLANARWIIDYDKTKFALQNGADTGVINGFNYDPSANNTVFTDGQTIATYTFKAIAQADATYDDFIISGTYAYTKQESYDSTDIVAANNSSVRVNIDLIDYTVVKKLNGNEVTTDTETVKFNAEPHTFVVETVPTAVVTYKVNGNEVSEVSIKEVGTYNITYTVTNATGYAPVSSGFKLVIEDPDFIVEVNTENVDGADYVNGKKLVLVHTNTKEVYFKYNNALMIDVSDSEYKYNGTKYTYVFAFVTDAIEGGDLEDYKAFVKPIYEDDGLYKIAQYTADINDDTRKDIRDITSVYGVNYADDILFSNIKYQKLILRADTNNDRMVEGADINFVIEAIYPSTNNQ